MMQSCHFVKEFFLFICLIVTRKWENKSAPIKLEIWSDFFLVINQDLVTQKQKNLSVNSELVTWNEIKFFKFFNFELVTQSTIFSFSTLS